MMKYKPTGVCSKEIEFCIEGNVLKEINFFGGCNGNLKGIKALVEGMEISVIIEKLQGITCGNKSVSCPSELAKCLKEYKN